MADATAGALPPSRLLAAKSLVFFPVPPREFCRDSEVVPLRDFVAQDHDAQAKAVAVRVRDGATTTDYCPGYLLLLQDAARETYMLAFLPRRRLPQPDPEHVLFKIEQYAEHFEQIGAPHASTLPAVTLPALYGALLRIETVALCRVDVWGVSEMSAFATDVPAAPVLGTAPPAATAPPVRIALHSSDPIASYPALVLVRAGPTPDAWIQRWLRLVALDAQRSSPQSSTFHVKPAYGVIVNPLNAQAPAQARNGWSLLEQFARITTLTRTTAATILAHPLSQAVAPFLPAPVREFIRSAPEADAILQDYGETAAQYLRRVLSMPAGGPADPALDSGSSLSGAASLEGASATDWELVDVLPPHVAFESQRELHPVSAEEWLALFRVDHGDGRLLDTSPAATRRLRRRVFLAGLETDIRPVAWKFLLGVYPWDAAEAERDAIDAQGRAAYARLANEWQEVAGDPALGSVAAPSYGGSADTGGGSAGDESENATREQKIRERLYRIGKDVVRTDRTVPFFAPAVKTALPDETPQGEALGVEGLAGASPADVEAHLERLKRVLMAYTMLEFDLGYVQGMNDLLAPLLVVQRDPADALWCFAQWMKQCQQNFSRTQTPMHRQLTLLARLLHFMDPELHQHLQSAAADSYFFCFRWLLVRFKREFEFAEIGRLWEVLWTRWLSPHFFFFVALAILQLHRRRLLEFAEFDEILKYTNDLSMRLPLEQLLKRAETLFYEFQWRMRRLEASALDSAPAALDSSPAALDSSEGAKSDEPSGNVGPSQSMPELPELPAFYTSTPAEYFGPVQPGWRGLLVLLYPRGHPMAPDSPEESLDSTAPQV